MSLAIALLCILFFGAALLLVIVNHGVVDVDLLFRRYPQVPVAVVMVVSLLAGIVFTSFISIIDGIRIRVQNRRLRKRSAQLEDALEELRLAPGRSPGEPKERTLLPGDDPRP